MKTIYAVMAWSPSKRQLQREFDQDSLSGNHTYDSKLAMKKAEAFAERLNSQKKLKTNDWQPKIEAITNFVPKKS
jgi:hypothetical protein